MDREIDMARACGLGHISFPVHTITLGQSVYPDIALSISNYYVYCIENRYLAKTASYQNSSRLNSTTHDRIFIFKHYYSPR